MHKYESPPPPPGKSRAARRPEAEGTGSRPPRASTSSSGAGSKAGSKKATKPEGPASDPSAGGQGDRKRRPGGGGGGGGRGGPGGGRTVMSLSSAPRPEEGAHPSSTSRPRRMGSPDIRLVALDMDGTLLDSSSKIRPRTVEAIRAALARGVNVVLATGKARPGAIKALQSVGLAGPGLVVDSRGPGVFLQGLAVFGSRGEQLSDRHLDEAVVRAAFEYSLQQDVPLCGFLGDDCVTARMHPELERLNTVYYEPLARVAGSVEELLRGPPVRKLLFMSNPERVHDILLPHWRQAVGGSASVVQAVPNMLEIVPPGANKGEGLRVLLPALGLPREALLACGDGLNDLEMVQYAGVGIAMGNAVAKVKEAATKVVASNDEDGIAEALEAYVL